MTTPNAVRPAVHDRMPVILDRTDYDLWADPGFTDVTAASELLKPYDARLMCCFAMSTWVNHAANDHAECAQRVDLGVPPQGQLFG
jgi:putative SOS response-associated peptidase YedK